MVVSISLIAFSLLAGPMNDEDPWKGFKSVRIESPNPVVTEPCEPVFVQLAVELAGNEDKRTRERAAVELARRVTINGVDHETTLLGAPINTVSLFTTYPGIAGVEDSQGKPLTVIGAFLWNSRTEDCVFPTNGRYRVDIGEFASFLVEIGAPDQEHASFAQKIRKIGREAGEAIEGDAREISPVTEGALKNLRGLAPNSQLWAILDLKPAQRETLRIESSLFKTEDFDEALRRFRELRPYFEPHVRPPLDNPWKLTAALELARLEGTIVLNQQIADKKAGRSGGKPERDRVEALVRLMRESPLAVMVEPQIREELQPFLDAKD